MRKIWIVAQREYRATVKTKTFIIALVVMPILMSGGIAVQVLTEGRIDTQTKRIAVLDHSGRMMKVLLEAVQKRNEKDIIDPQTGRMEEPAYELVEIRPKEDREEQLLELSNQIRNEQFFAFLEIPADILQFDADNEEMTIAYYSNQPTYQHIRRWLSRNINSRVQSVRFEEVGIDQKVVQQAMQPVDIDNLQLVVRDESGKVQEAEKVDPVRAFGVPFGLTMLMFMAMAITTQPLLNSVLEEKMQRIAEVLLGSVTPFELMIGKLLGYVSVALTLVGVYLAGGYFVADRLDYSGLVPAPLLGWFILFLSLAVLMFGALFIAAGSCCNDYKEAQNLMLPIWLVVCIPLFALGPVLDNPNSGFATALSLFPPATPMLMVMRLAIPPGAAIWQVLVGVGGTLLTTLLFVWAAAKIFRLGLLMQGKSPKITDLFKLLVRA